MTGPLILITLGVLFLLNNLDPLRFQFGRMWPVILIVIGLVKIFEFFDRSGRYRRRPFQRPHERRRERERYAARSSGPESAPPGDGEPESRA